MSKETKKQEEEIIDLGTSGAPEEVFVRQIRDGRGRSYTIERDIEPDAYEIPVKKKMFKKKGPGRPPKKK